MLILTETGQWQLLASTMGLRHFAIHNDRVVREEEWRKLGETRDPRATVSLVFCSVSGRVRLVFPAWLTLALQEDIPVDAEVIVGIVDNVLSGRVQ
jgi:hypothetical protein